MTVRPMSVPDDRPNKSTPGGSTPSTRLTWAFFLAVLIGAGCSSGSKPAGSSGYATTRLTPLQGGATRQLSAFRGKPLVVNLWAPWCTPCVREMPAFDEVHRDLGDDVTIIGVTDSLDRVGSKRLAASTGVTYPLLVDEGGNLQTDLGVVNLPTTVFFDAEGKIIRRHAGAFTARGLEEAIESLYDLD